MYRELVELLNRLTKNQDVNDLIKSINKDLTKYESDYFNFCKELDKICWNSLDASISDSVFEFIKDIISAYPTVAPTCLKALINSFATDTIKDLSYFYKYYDNTNNTDIATSFLNNVNRTAISSLLTTTNNNILEYYKQQTPTNIVNDNRNNTDGVSIINNNNNDIVINDHTVVNCELETSPTFCGNPDGIVENDNFTEFVLNAIRLASNDQFKICNRRISCICFIYKHFAVCRQNFHSLVYNQSWNRYKDLKPILCYIVNLLVLSEFLPEKSDDIYIIIFDLMTSIDCEVSRKFANEKFQFMQVVREKAFQIETLISQKSDSIDPSDSDQLLFLHRFDVVFNFLIRFLHIYLALLKQSNSTDSSVSRHYYRFLGSTIAIFDRFSLSLINTNFLHYIYLYLMLIDKTFCSTVELALWKNICRFTNCENFELDEYSTQILESHEFVQQFMDRRVLPIIKKMKNATNKFKPIKRQKSLVTAPYLSVSVQLNAKVACYSADTLIKDAENVQKFTIDESNKVNTSDLSTERSDSFKLVAGKDCRIIDSLNFCPIESDIDDTKLVYLVGRLELHKKVNNSEKLSQQNCIFLLGNLLGNFPILFDLQQTSLYLFGLCCELNNYQKLLITKTTDSFDSLSFNFGRQLDHQTSFYLKHQYYYCLFQVVIYVISLRCQHLFHSKEFNELDLFIVFVRSLCLDNYVFSDLNPLSYCPDFLTDNFCVLTHRFGLMYCFNLVEKNRKLRKTYYSSTMASSIIDSNFQLPFEKFLLPLSLNFFSNTNITWKDIPVLTSVDAYLDDNDEFGFLKDIEVVDELITK